MLRDDQLAQILALFDSFAPSDFINSLLTSRAHSVAATAFISSLPSLLSVLQGHASTKDIIKTLIIQAAEEYCRQEVCTLTTKTSGWQFGARVASAEQLLNFSMRSMADEFSKQAPTIWGLLGTLLNADPSRESRRTQALMTGLVQVPDTIGDLWDEDDEYFAQLEENEVATPGECADQDDRAGNGVSKRQRRAIERRAVLIRVKRVVIINIMMQSTNQKCNALASLIGLFCHSTSTPELVLEMLAHSGLSVSPTAVHNMVSSLSEGAHKQLREIASTRIASFVYDNFDMDFKSWQHTVDKPGSTLVHATSAFAFTLQHGVTPDDLKHARSLWSTDPLNPRTRGGAKRAPRSWLDAMHAMHPPRNNGNPAPAPAPALVPATAPTSPMDPAPGPSPAPAPAPNASSLPKRASPLITQRILAWHFRNALVTYCTGFSYVRQMLGQPETILQIPVMKTSTVPCRAMDIDQSTNDGQADIVENLFRQAGIGIPEDTPDVLDISEHVVLFHGDLGTGERQSSIKESRRIEANSVRSLQVIVFVFGLFHLQMAAVEAIWRMYIEPKPLRSSPTGLYQQACSIRPHDTGRIGSKPAFRLMHEIILQCATARMLDCWRVEASLRDPKIKTLEDFAASKPTWSRLTKMSLEIASKYVNQPSAQDIEFRNNSLILSQLLLYVELYHAMKRGDIGRVEATFMPWAFIFKSVGKHKYSTQLIKTINDLHYVYPPRLTRAIRLNWLCNPTGRPDGFRGLDWDTVRLNKELYNFYTKVVFSGSGQTQTLNLVIKQSPLIEVFRSVHTVIQDNFGLLHRSTRHAPKNLSRTIEILCSNLNKNRAHCNDESRKDAKIPKVNDHMQIGITRMHEATEMSGGADEDEVEGRILDDISAEDLDI
ncbi:hypothetical protein BC834DRAFT_1040462 [Gloeopeniophorella convolvens]|nr:hypothetical protein BC834DRAFT_1040462 [Gloeopeniophorella convolvens]